MRRPGTTFPAGPVALRTSPRVEIRDELDWATRSTPHLSSLMEHVICLGRQSGKNSCNKNEVYVRVLKGEYLLEPCNVKRQGNA